MAVFALNVIDEMGACIMLRPLLLMTSMARDWFRVNSCPLCFGMNFDICDIIVAAVTGVGPMNGLGKLPLADFIMAGQTFRIVNTLIAILPTLNNELLRLFGWFRGFGHLWGPDTLFIGSRCCRPQHPEAPKERDRDDETNKD
jgi:hypothetical protein